MSQIITDDNAVKRINESMSKTLYEKGLRFQDKVGERFSLGGIQLFIYASSTEQYNKGEGYSINIHQILEIPNFVSRSNGFNGYPTCELKGDQTSEWTYQWSIELKKLIWKNNCYQWNHSGINNHNNPDFYIETNNNRTDIFLTTDLHKLYHTRHKDGKPLIPTTAHFPRKYWDPIKQIPYHGAYQPPLSPNWEAALSRFLLPFEYANILSCGQIIDDKLLINPIKDVDEKIEKISDLIHQRPREKSKFKYIEHTGPVLTSTMSEYNHLFL